ncbi:P-type cation-transporting ATPase [Zopfochytrium polystomum]|nr:P-type cation-transporting ATPase [Zopfochytrium polystomum]
MSKAPSTGADQVRSSAPFDPRAEQHLHRSHVVVAENKRGAQKKGKVKKLDIDEHLMTLEEVCQRHSVSVDAKKPASSEGLSPAVASDRLAIHGPNVLTPPKKKHWIVRFLECLLNLFNILLLLAGFGTYVLFIMDPLNNFQNSYIGGILIGVAFLNGFIEFYQLQKSASVLESFMNMIPAKCTVIRNSQTRQLPAAELVPGDLVYVRLGDKIPADLYMFHVADLKVDNSSLTGESDPQERATENTQKNPLEATNLCFNGTLAVSGEGYGIVVATGDSTVLGQIAGLTTAEVKRESPLTLEIERFCKIISFFAFSTAVVFFFVSLFKSGNFSYSLSFAIGILVAWVPQGLPATVTMLLTIAAKRMASRQVLVKDLTGVETLGAITMLCTDKTGTLTRNQMTVTNLWVDGKMFVAGPTAGEELALDDSVPGVMEIVYMSALCSRAKFDRTDAPVEKRGIIGDATESGLLRFVGKKLATIDKVHDQFPKRFDLPFNSDTKTHTSIHRMPHKTGPLTLFMKGAPERVLRNCASILRDGQPVDMTEAHRDEFTKAYEAMAGKGHRVLAFAQLQMHGEVYGEEHVFTKEELVRMDYQKVGLCFVGLVSLEDPPKHGVREAVGRLRTAGIKVVMVTGDHPLTAEAIARKINLVVGDTRASLARRTNRDPDDVPDAEATAVVVHGEEIAGMTDEDWDAVFAKDEIVFARTSPKDKLEIVKRAQALGHIVGVTGDGVNDSPALKKADLGIAMNQSGSDVSKEAAAMILLDDNFASTVAGITEGRLIFVNLKKSIQYAVSHIIPEVVPYLLYVVVPIPLALTAIQILVIDLGFELLAALSYAWEPPETTEGLMALAPRKPVTDDSIAALRRKHRDQILAGIAPPAPRGARDPNGDGENLAFPEDEDWVVPSRFRRYAHELRCMADYKYWVELFSGVGGEVLVDAEVLSWAYLEAGVIECVGALTTFFVVLGWGFGIDVATAVYAQADGRYFMPHSPDLVLPDGSLLSGDLQWEALKQAQSAFYLAVLVIQMWNLFTCKARIRLPWGWFMFQNKKTWISLAAGVFFGFLIVYTPFMNALFGTSMNLNPAYLSIPMAFGFLLLIYGTLRRAFMGRFAPYKTNKEIRGLQMYETSYSLANLHNAV